jgi:hypothetical protein
MDTKKIADAIIYAGLIIGLSIVWGLQFHACNLGMYIK